MTLNPDLWDFMWYQRFEADRPTADTYTPIAPVDVPVVFDSHLIAILATSTMARSTWVTAGWLNQRVSSGVISRSYPDADLLQSKRIILGKVTLLELPKLTSEFAINYVVPRWFVDINLTFWKYKEQVIPGSTIDAVESVKNSLLNIERKLDRIRREQ